MRLYKKKDEINIKEWIEHEIFMFSFSVNFGEKTNKIKEIYMYWFEWWNELCYNVRIWRIGRRFTKERRKFSCFSLNLIFWQIKG